MLDRARETRSGAQVTSAARNMTCRPSPARDAPGRRLHGPSGSVGGVGTATITGRRASNGHFTLRGWGLWVGHRRGLLHGHGEAGKSVPARPVQPVEQPTAQPHLPRFRSVRLRPGSVGSSFGSDPRLSVGVALPGRERPLALNWTGARTPTILGPEHSPRPAGGCSRPRLSWQGGVADPTRGVPGRRAGPGAPLLDRALGGGARRPCGRRGGRLADRRRRSRAGPAPAWHRTWGPGVAPVLLRLGHESDAEPRPRARRRGHPPGGAVERLPGHRGKPLRA